ncbi:hypothetical protein SAMN05446589_1101 [Streptomyces sp. OV198]|jgi:hypothetical protein|nr:hypothetical protein SAMN05446589_1101 [Streptomyces sp. OV198]
MLGLAIGDTLGAARGKPPASGSLRAGVSTQLACFTAEGVIRAMVRGSHKGICHPPGVVLHAYCRWAALQGIEVERMRRRWASAKNGEAWPDGGLAGVHVLAERRGSAPATLTALSRIEDPHEQTATASRGVSRTRWPATCWPSSPIRQWQRVRPGLGPVLVGPLPRLVRIARRFARDWGGFGPYGLADGWVRVTAPAVGERVDREQARPDSSFEPRFGEHPHAVGVADAAAGRCRLDAYGT